MKQLFYAVAVIVVLFFAMRLMSKVKDLPEEKPEDPGNDDENGENNRGEI